MGPSKRLQTFYVHTDFKKIEGTLPIGLMLISSRFFVKYDVLMLVDVLLMAFLGMNF